MNKICDCGETVWNSTIPGSLPKYQEQILCRRCGADHSRRPPLFWRIRYGFSRLRKQYRCYGLRQTAVHWIFRPWLLEREREMKADAIKKIEQQRQRVKSANFKAKQRA